MNLTVHLLVRNNEQDIEQSLQSLVVLDCPILIGDQGSTDNSLAICRKFKAKIIPVTNNCSVARNVLIENTKTPWAFYIQPWEVLAQGHRHLENLQSNSWLCQIFQENIVSKEIRLWSMSSGFRFVNPIFETLYDPNAKLLKEVIIYSKKQPPLQGQLDVIRSWKKEQPTSPNPYYYEACILLQQAKYREFVAISNHYLFLEKEGISAVMLKYYLAMVYCYQFKDLHSAFKHILPCLAVRPIMSEFWCLLGDIYYQQDNFQKAMIFYENALILGGRRDLSDEWPIEISKYKSYPQKMINSCSNIKKSKHYCHESKSI
ncbi:MAG: hypothetical protein M0R80_02955 [Proteobacteria bacterium]|jgi:tetratricopeptide (TPR) repeat protein|nr:hypothetical protein [Pseudomonadota bacterium]